MKATEYAHYDIRGREPSPGEIERAEAIRSSIPAGVERILDCGCGDGRVGNAIRSEYRVMGCDIAPLSLKRCGFPAVRSFTQYLPFADDAFDLVISSEVLEHILPDDYERSCREIDRVVTRWIIVTVPYRENLDAARQCCPHCHTIFHDAWHLRSFDERRLEASFPNFEPRQWYYLGGKQRTDMELRRRLRNKLRGYPRLWPERQCPMCGRFGTDSGEAPAFAEKVGGARGAPKRSAPVAALRKLASRIVPGHARWLGCLMERRAIHSPEATSSAGRGGVADREVSR